jgi:hypothetical protein
MAVNPIHEAVQQALEARQTEQAERQERLDAAAAKILAHSAELKAAKEQQEREYQATLRARQAERQQAKYDRLKRQYRARFSGPDAAFEAVWPDVLKAITAAQPVHRVTRL